MAKRYKQVKAGEWVHPVANGYRLACCDCGLVHEIDFRIARKLPGSKEAGLKFRTFRNRRATAAMRRGKVLILL